MKHYHNPIEIGTIFNEKSYAIFVIDANNPVENEYIIAITQKVLNLTPHQYNYDYIKGSMNFMNIQIPNLRRWK